MTVASSLISLPAEAPFHLEATVRVLQRRSGNPVDVWRDGRYRRVLSVASQEVLVEVRNRGSIDEPDLILEILSAGASRSASRSASEMLRRMLGLDVDPTPLQRLADVEPALRPTVRALRGMRPPRFAGLFEAFASVIPFQQLSIDAGIAILSRLVERFGSRWEHHGAAYHGFPEPRAVAQADVGALRGCGFSRKKAETLQLVARAVADGDLQVARLAALESPAAHQALTRLPGIGPWSAGLVLLRGLGRLDVFPAGDVGAARKVGGLLRLEPGESVDDVVHRFGDSRGYLYYCGLGSSLLEQGLIEPAPGAAR